MWLSVAADRAPCLRHVVSGWSRVRLLGDAMLRNTDEHRFETRKLGSHTPPQFRLDLSLPPRLASMLLPVNARALGIAMGLTLGVLVTLVTTFHVIVRPSHAPNIGLLTQFFYGYAVSPQGIAVGFIWGFVTGLVFGWLAGLVRNAILRLRLIVLHRSASLTQPFLDDLS